MSLKTKGLRRVRCEALGEIATLPDRPERVVCLVSGFTEAIWEMGLSARVTGVSKFCNRYVDTEDRVVVGDYLRIDEAELAKTTPDLVLLTGGVQLGVARRLAKAGFPVFVLPLPDSYHGVLENIRRLGALLGEMPAAHALTAAMESKAATLRAKATPRRPAVYAEMWFGRHPRMVGGLTFVHDILEYAGCANVLAHKAEGYLEIDRAEIAAARPELIVLFHEEDDHPLNVDAWRRESGWTGAIIEAGIAKGRNLLHDGPSMLETAAWLRGEMESLGFPLHHPR